MNDPTTGRFIPRDSERAEGLDPDYDTEYEYDDWYDFDEAATERAEMERDLLEQHDQDRADDARFEADREADYEYELACRLVREEAA